MILFYILLFIFHHLQWIGMIILEFIMEIIEQISNNAIILEDLLEYPIIILDHLGIGTNKFIEI